MISSPRVPTRSPWLMTLLSVVLTLGASAALIYFFKDGAPSRLIFSSLLAVLVLVPVLLRWQLGWLIIFLLLPWVSFLRRFYLLYDANIAAYSYDLLALLPDAVLATTALGLFLTQRARRMLPVMVNDRWLRIPLGLFMGLCAIEIFNPFMGSVPAGINGFRAFTLWILLYFITQQAIQRKEQVYQWIAVTLISGTGVALYGTYQYIVGFPAYDMIWAEAYRVTTQVIGEAMRPFSTFSFVSTFSHYMVITACLGIVALRLKGLGVGTKLLSPFYLACILTGLSLSFVRSSYMGLFAAGILAVIMIGKPEVRWKRLLVAALAVGVLVALVPKGKGEVYQGEASTGGLVAQRVMTLTEPTKAGSMQLRFEAWEYVLNSSLEYPIGRGIGLGQAGRFSNNFGAQAASYTESQYFTMLAELGWPGLLLYLWIVGYGFVLSVRIYDRLRDPDLRRLAEGCLMIQAGLGVIGFTGGVVLYTVPGSAYFWASLGIVTVLPRLDKAADEAVA